MDLKTFQFPEVTKADIAFSTFGTDATLLKEAKSRGFYNGRTPYNKLFSKLFFSGGTVKIKDNIDTEFYRKAWMYFRALIGSFEMNHEDKEAICAMLLSEIAEPELEENGSK